MFTSTLQKVTNTEIFLFVIVVALIIKCYLYNVLLENIKKVNEDISRYNHMLYAEYMELSKVTMKVVDNWKESIDKNKE